MAGESGVSKDDILCTYCCTSCSGYEVKNFAGQDQPCKFCGNKKGLATCNVTNGVTEDQLNEVYNLMNVYCHPFTSGGQEIPIQEAKLAELITLVTNYSCGEEMCEPEAQSLALDWTEYREHQTEFIKASTNPSSIAKQLTKVFKMKPSKKAEMGKSFSQLYSYAIQRYIKGAYVLTEKQKAELKTVLVETEKSCIGKILGLQQKRIQKWIEQDGLDKLTVEHDRLLGNSEKSGELVKMLRFSYGEQGGEKREWPLQLSEPKVEK